MDYDANMLKGVVDPIILNLVSERAMYGYEIIKVIHEAQWSSFTASVNAVLMAPAM
jgi:DNA-binding PadR family transcriptional regulator